MIIWYALLIRYSRINWKAIFPVRSLKKRQKDWLSFKEVGQLFKADFRHIVFNNKINQTLQTVCNFGYQANGIDVCCGKDLFCLISAKRFKELIKTNYSIGPFGLSNLYEVFQNQIAVHWFEDGALAGIFNQESNVGKFRNILNKFID